MGIQPVSGVSHEDQTAPGQTEDQQNSLLAVGAMLRSHAAMRR